jgi:hypothetical protein
MPIVIAPGGPRSRPTWTVEREGHGNDRARHKPGLCHSGLRHPQRGLLAVTGLPQIRDLGFIVAGPPD